MESELTQWSTGIGTALGTLIAAFAVSDRVVAISVFLIERWKKRRLEARLRAILIIPTLPEIAKYSIQSPQPREPIEIELASHALRKEKQRHARRLESRAQYRLLVILLSFAMTYIAIGMKFVIISYGKG